MIWHHCLSLCLVLQQQSCDILLAVGRCEVKRYLAGCICCFDACAKIQDSYQQISVFFEAQAVVEMRLLIVISNGDVDLLR